MMDGRCPESLDAALGQRRAPTGHFKKALVTRKNSDVCGSKATEESWEWLDFSRARLRTQSTLMLVIAGPKDAPQDLHLDVPARPDGHDEDWAWLRVRPLSKKVTGAVFDRGFWYWTR